MASTAALIFKLATIDECPKLLEVVNAGYTISEEFMWKPGVLRTNLEDLQTTAHKTFLDQDMFITARETSSGDLVGSIRYEPRIELEQLDADNNVVATIPLKFDQIFPTPPQDDLNQIYTMIQQQEVFKPFESHLKRSSVYANVISQLEQNNTCKKISLKSIGHFSMFVVDSTKQGRGYGDLLLNHIQNVTLCLGQIVKLLLQMEVSDNYYDVEMKAKMEMVVLSPRQDMIKFYEKRGYSCVGQLPPEPYMLPNVKEEYHDLLELIYERQLEYPAGGVKA